MIIDIGCGKGRVLAMCARKKVRKVVGIDLDQALIQHAERNAALVRGRRSNVEVHHTNALNFDYSEATVLLLNNPFGPDTLAKWLEAIRQSLQRNPRPLRCAFAHASVQQEEVLRSATWLRCESWHYRRVLRRSQLVVFAYANYQEQAGKEVGGRTETPSVAGVHPKAPSVER